MTLTIGTAILSPCRLYRYELRRIWDNALPPFVVGMLNRNYPFAEEGTIGSMPLTDRRNLEN